MPLSGPSPALLGLFHFWTPEPSQVVAITRLQPLYWFAAPSDPAACSQWP